MAKEVSNHDIIEAIGVFSNKVEERFDKVDQRLDTVDGRLDKVEGQLSVIETKLDRALYTEIVHLEARVKRLEQKVGVTTQGG